MLVFRRSNATVERLHHESTFMLCLAPTHSDIKRAVWTSTVELEGRRTRILNSGRAQRRNLPHGETDQQHPSIEIPEHSHQAAFLSVSFLILQQTAAVHTSIRLHASLHFRICLWMKLRTFGSTFKPFETLCPNHKRTTFI